MINRLTILVLVYGLITCDPIDAFPAGTNGVDSLRESRYIIKTAPLTLLETNPYISVGAEVPLQQGWSAHIMAGYHYPSDHGVANDGPIRYGWVIQPALRYYLNENRSAEGAFLGFRYQFRRVAYEIPRGFRTSNTYSSSSSSSAYNCFFRCSSSNNYSAPNYTSTLQDKFLHRGNVYGGYQWKWGQFLTLEVFGGIGLRHITEQQLGKKSTATSITLYPQTYSSTLPDFNMGGRIGISF